MEDFRILDPDPDPDLYNNSPGSASLQCKSGFEDGIFEKISGLASATIYIHNRRAVNLDKVIDIFSAKSRRLAL